MPTVIDALIVELGLDPRQFTKGQKEVAEGLVKTRGQAKRTTDDIEAYGKRAANYIAGLKNEVIGLFLAFAGAKGLSDLATGMISTAASAGRLSANIGVATDRIGAWQTAVKEMGGTADEANSALNSMATAIGNYNLTRSTGNDAVFRALGVNLSDIQAGPEAMLLKIAKAGETMGRGNYVNLLQRLGFGPAMIATLEQGRGKLQQILPVLAEQASLTQKDADAAQQLQKKLADLSALVQGNLRQPLTELVDQLLTLARNKEDLQTAGDVITAAIGAIGLAALAAYWPVAALAGAIALVLKAKHDWDNGDGWVKFKNDGGASARAKAADPKDPYGKGLIGGLERMWNSDWFSIKQAPGGGASGGGGSPTLGRADSRFRNGVGGLQGFIMSQGFTAEQAAGIAAGIFAESGGNPNAVNPTSGAYGLGQWLGDRKARLFSRYGSNPTAQQQLEFLGWELNGGDRGAGAVHAASSADDALHAYIIRFMRPKAGMETVQDLARGRRYLANAGSSVGSINLNGPITITTQAKDAQGLASQLPGAVRRRALATPANSGVQ